MQVSHNNGLIQQSAMRLMVMCVNYHVHLKTFLYGSDHSEYTQKAYVWKVKLNAKETRKVCANENRLRSGKMEAIHQVP